MGRSLTWEQLQARAAVERAIKKWGPAYEMLGHDLKWAVVCVELVTLVYLQVTENDGVKSLQGAITAAQRLTEEP